MSQYNANIPQPRDILANSQQDLLTNFTALNTVFGIDHFPFNNNTAEDGFHTIIHQDPSTRTRSGGSATYTNFPAAIPNVQQIISAVYTPQATVSTPDTQLFGMTGTGIISQLTGQIIGTPAANTNLNDGYCWIGGILIQWGSNTATSSGSFGNGSASGTITFKDRIPGAIPFPNNIFSVITVPYWSDSTGQPDGSGSVTISRSTSGNLTNTKGFSWSFNSNSHDYVGFTWVALGN